VGVVVGDFVVLSVGGVVGISVVGVGVGPRMVGEGLGYLGVFGS